MLTGGLLALTTIAVLAAPASAGSPAARADASAPSPTDPASGTPSPTPTPGPPALDPLPTHLVTSLPLTVSGTAQPGEVIDVSGGSSPGADARCSVTSGADGRFRCAIPRLPDGPGVPVRAESRSTGLADSGRVDVLSPPVITSAAGGATGGGIRGTAYPGSRVTVTAETGDSCTFPADGAGGWGCVVAGLRDGTHTVSATQVAPFSPTRSGPSGSVTIVVDTTAPAAPTLTAPAPGTTVSAGQPLAFAGAGESGATVTVYASTPRGTTVACTAAVAAGAWSCSGTLPPGDYLISALQRDAAGNVSAGSNTVATTVEATAAAPSTPTQKPSPSAAPVPGQAAPPAAPTAPPAAAVPGPHSWTETPFTTASAPVVSAASVPGWLRSVGLAVAALLLLVLPGRLLVAALGRPRAPHSAGAALFGRNRARSELGEADALLRGGQFRGAENVAAAGAQPVWVAPVVGGTAAALVTLSTSVQDAGAYLRLLSAVTLAVLAVNAIWVFAARGMTRQLGLPIAQPVIRPWLLVVVAAAALGSRLLGLEPALLFGLVVGTVLPEAAGRAARGRTAAVQLSAVAALGALAWLSVGVLPVPSGDASAFGVELANSVALLAIGSTAIALLPFGGLPGRAVLRWSRPVWLALALVVYTVLFALLLPVASLVQAGAGMIVLLIGAVAFAVVSVSLWLWERFVEPAR